MGVTLRQYPQVFFSQHHDIDTSAFTNMHLPKCTQAHATLPGLPSLWFRLQHYIHTRRQDVKWNVSRTVRFRTMEPQPSPAKPSGYLAIMALPT